MARESFRRRVAQSRWARTAILPLRVNSVVAANAKQARLSARWLAASREHTNYTYELTDLNFTHLAWWVSAVAGADVASARRMLCELQQDAEIHEHVKQATLDSSRRGLSDAQARFGRRLGWYALVRLTRPALVVETGTDKGLGALAVTRALQRNGEGRLITVDTNPDAGLLLRGFHGPYDVVIADSVSTLSGMTDPVDLFIHDSLHTRQHELAELAAVEVSLSSSATVLSDNSHVTDALPSWAESRGKRFLFFAEKPQEHWYPGGGIGAAW